MPDFAPTPQQERAIQTVGRSLLVSAAAGSGKTEVLARRCVHLVCDAPHPFRCDIDQLLVLTFTEAAAAEMRARIVRHLRGRLADHPDDARLRRQIAWADMASISTIHAFCNTLIRRHFAEAGIDPSSTILDGQEAWLLRGDVLRRLFDRLYAAAGDGDSADHALGVRFVRCVDDYGLGEDRTIAEFLTRVAAFLDSLPDPGGWIAGARVRFADGGDQLLHELLAALAQELEAQTCELTAFSASLKGGEARAAELAACVDQHAEVFRHWRAELMVVSAEAASPAVLQTAERRFESVQSAIQAYAFDKPARLKRKNKNADAADDRFNAAIDRFVELRDRMFRDRLKRRCAAFSLADVRDGTARVAPFAETLLELVVAFRAAYEAAKRRADVLDFADLERFAHQLLSPFPKDALPRSSRIAAEVRRRFHHVLVDEFQDVSPIQAAIIEQSSREPDPAQPGNLFVVGDVKQSIYRFRLAEPGLFVERHQQLEAGGSDGGEVIPLQLNYRSTRPVLDFVNTLFSKLMARGISPIEYDESAVLRPGRANARESAPVEIHLVERGAEAEPADLDDPEEPSDEWIEVQDARHASPMEREARLIGRRILQLRADDRFRVQDRRAEFRDFAVLLRAARGNAKVVERVLQGMGVASFAEAGGGFLDAREIREMLAVLRVLDNPQQDIPLASVLRMGMFAEPLSVDDLAIIRVHDRSAPFHRAVLDYARKGDHVELREKLTLVLARIESWRRDARVRPLAEVLWGLYDSTAYLARASAWPDGDTRRANLLRLHEYARTFGSFRQQGLHRFLSFMDSLAEESQQPDAASPHSESEDAVRILTIHRSKGLEFPVVFVAGLGSKWNFSDSRGRLIFARAAGLGLHAVRPDLLVEYPTASHLLAQEELDRATREEELRVLYVALTRAREKLILTACPAGQNLLDYTERARAGALRASTHALRTLNCPLDAILPVLSEPGRAALEWFDGDVPLSAPREATDLRNTRIHVWTLDQMADWNLAPATPAGRDALIEAAAALAPLPQGEPMGSSDAPARDVLHRLDWVYPHAPLTTLRSVVSASEFKGAFDPLSEADGRPGGTTVADSVPWPVGAGDWRQDEGAEDPSPREAGLPAADRSRRAADREGARRRGVATHRLLQHLDFKVAPSGAWRDQVPQLLASHVLDPADRDLVDDEAVDWFLSTPLARRIAEAGDRFHREFAYIAAEPPEVFDRALSADSPDDHVMVRGIVDGVLVEEDCIEIVDYKTDDIDARKLAHRTDRYRPQVALYARAMSRLWRRPARACHLVFLSPRSIRSLGPAGGSARGDSLS